MALAEGDGPKHVDSRLTLGFLALHNDQVWISTAIGFARLLYGRHAVIDLVGLVRIPPAQPKARWVRHDHINVVLAVPRQLLLPLGKNNCR